MTSWNGASYTYDRLNRRTRYLNGSEDWRFLYTANDERIVMERSGGNGEIWSLRGLDGKVLREYRADVSASDYRDYVWRGGALLSKVEPQMQQILDPKGNLIWTRTGETVEASVVDHLGTIRRFSNGAGQGQSAHSYYPFGVEQTTSTDGERLKFTGQERDTWNTTNPADDLDYFHARHYNPQLGRFLQIDPLSGSAGRPQTLNRYAYVGGNPINSIDPFGRDIFSLSISPLLIPIDAGGGDGGTVIGKDPCSTPIEWSCIAWMFRPGGSDSGNANDGLLMNQSHPTGPFDVPPPTTPDPKKPDPKKPKKKRCIPVSTGLSFTISTILGGGWGLFGDDVTGGIWGFNIQELPGKGIVLFGMHTPSTEKAHGINIGAAFTANVAAGNGPWTGRFLTAEGGAGIVSFGGFETPSDEVFGKPAGEVGWYGVEGGVSLSPFAAGEGSATVTYTPLLTLVDDPQDGCW